MRLVRRIYVPRMLGLALGAVCVDAALYQVGAPPWLWGLLAFNGLLWPHLAYQWAMRSASPYQRERRNLLLDAAYGGFWVPAMGFNVLPSVLILAMLSMDNIAVGGLALWLRGLLAHLAGAAVALLVLPLRFEPASNFTTLLASLPFLVAYPLTIGIVTYRLSLQLSRQKHELRRLSEQDPMSGLYSRSHWEKRQTEEFQAFQRHGRSVSLMLVDVDRFKEINDGHGHAAGDEVIRRVGQVLREQVRQGDIVGRYGGDEFGVIFPGMGAGEAHKVAQRIRASLAGSGLLAYDGAAPTLSIGIAPLLPGTPSCAAWIAQADKALYKVKRAGRDGVEVYPDEASASLFAPQS
ncbi:diguanylate cyclase [Ramlibacter sp. 2FC]|uniref:diguanylate cyclase n=1 Tax=Ramlibacter sp. 2FC TaxID=2502188 RepID=UPI0014857647|nr:diguanylate cyclase [Ramlibacter sp. 2FC]